MTKLHHQIAKAYLNNAGKKLNLKDLETARKNFDAALDNRFKQRIASIQNTATDSGTKLRIYRNNSSPAKRPVIVYFHGGGFVMGSITSHDSVCRDLAKATACAVISVAYSLAPESKHPVPIEEGLQVLGWLQRSDDLNGIDASRIFLAGDSAGGTIALGIATDPRLAIRLNGLVLIYPALDPDLSTESMEQLATGHFLTMAMLKEFWNMYQGDTAYHVPTDVELNTLPPVILISGGKDVLRDEGFALVKKLHALGKDVEYAYYDDMLHGFMQHPRIVSRKTQAMQQIADFTKKHI
jgi:acetyl esterase